MLDYGLHKNMLTPPIYSFTNNLINERKMKKLIKANSKYIREYSRTDNRDTPINANSLSSKRFKKLSLKKADTKLNPAPQKSQVKNQYFTKDSQLDKNENISKSVDLITNPRLKTNKIAKQFENFSGLKSLLNELLIDKKLKCTKCLKCFCECPEILPDPQPKRLKFKSRLNTRSKAVPKKIKSIKTPIDRLNNQNPENDCHSSNRREISFSLIQDQSYSAIHSNPKVLKRSPIKKRCQTAHKPTITSSNIDLILSVSSVSLSNRPK